MKLQHLSVALCLCAPLLMGSAARAAVIGVSISPPGITAERITALPAERRAAWQAYLKRSQAQRAADKAALAAERKPGMPVPPPPPDSFHDRSMPLDKDAAWYGTPEARHIADVIVSFQTPAGGWGKNQDFSKAPRLPGQMYAPFEEAAVTSAADFGNPAEVTWHYVGTIDNDATTTQMRFLARVAKQTPGAAGAAYRAGFLRGVRYLLAAQFPNGGWPQIWPLEGGYHDAITFNDDAVAHAAELLTAVGGNADGDYAFVSQALRNRAAAAARRAVDCILATQVVVNGRRTIWGQQHDALTLQPEAARNFEPVALSAGESAGLLVYLMSLPDPSPRTVAAVHAGVAWLKSAAIAGYAWTGQDTPEGRRLVKQDGAGPLWARFYAVDSLWPVFGDRDKTIHDDVNDLIAERRNGYSWYNATPKKALKAYKSWSAAHPLP